MSSIILEAKSLTKEYKQTLALRHSHASLLISMGENPLLIKERLGHEKIQTTLGTYGQDVYKRQVYASFQDIIYFQK